MRMLVAICMALLAVTAAGEQPKSTATGPTIEQTDRYGNIQHHKPSWVVKDDGRIVEVDQYGREKPWNPGFRVEADRVSPTDRFGNAQHDQPSWVVEKDGRIVETDRFGNRQYHKPGFQIRGTEVHQTDRYGNRGNQTHEIKGKTSQPAPATGASKPKSSGK